jgi:hypothetical protein
MYNLANRFGLEKLKALAFAEIASRIREANIADELFSKFTAKNPEFQEIEIKFAYEHYTDLVSTRIRNKIEELVDGEHQHAKLVFKEFLRGLQPRGTTTATTEQKTDPSPSTRSGEFSSGFSRRPPSRPSTPPCRTPSPRARFWGRAPEISTAPLLVVVDAKLKSADLEKKEKKKYLRKEKEKETGRRAAIGFTSLHISGWVWVVGSLGCPSFSDKPHHGRRKALFPGRHDLCSGSFKTASIHA